MAHFCRFSFLYEDEDHDHCHEPTDTGVLIVGIIFFVIVGCCVGACIIVVVFLGVEWCRSLWRERQQRQEQETRRQEVLARAIARRRPTTENRKEYVNKEEHALYSHTLEQGESARNLPALLASTNDDDENDTTVPPQGNVFTRMWRKTEESARSVRESIRNKAGPKPVCSICLQDFATEETISWAKNEDCNHIYHQDCIVEWLVSHDNCPLCRKTLLNNAGSDSEA